MDGMDGWLSYTAVTPRASLKSDANKIKIKKNSQGSVMIYLAELVEIYKPLLCNQHRFHLSGDHFK